MTQWISNETIILVPETCRYVTLCGLPTAARKPPMCAAGRARKREEPRRLQAEHRQAGSP